MLLNRGHEQMVPDARPSLALTFGPQQVLRWQLAAIGTLLLLSTLGQAAIRWLDWIPGATSAGLLFYVDGEQRVPAFYSSCALLVASLLLAAMAVATTGSERRAWSLLATTFAWLTLDEALAIHERLISPVRDALGIESGLLFFAWVLPAAGLLALLAVPMIGFLRRLPTDTSRAFVMSAALYLGGGMGVEALTGAWLSAGDIDARFMTWRYVLFVSIEEGMEMIGVALFIAAIIRHARRHLDVAAVNLALVDS